MMALLLVTLILNWGCAAKTFPDYPERPINEYPYTGEIEDGLAVALDPLLSNTETNKYFDNPLLEYKILAIGFSAENRNPTTSFVLSPDRMVLKEVQFGKPSLDQVATFTTAKTLGIIGLVCACMLMVPAEAAFLITSAHLASDVACDRDNVVCKELRTTTLSPGEKAQGFLYFYLPQISTIPDRLVVHLEAMDLGTQEWQSFDLPIAWKR